MDDIERDRLPEARPARLQVLDQPGTDPMTLGSGNQVKLAQIELADEIDNLYPAYILTVDNDDPSVA